MAEEKKEIFKFNELSRLVIQNYEILQEALGKFLEDIKNFRNSLKDKLNNLLSQNYQIEGLSDAPSYSDIFKKEGLLDEIDDYFIIKEDRKTVYSCGLVIKRNKIDLIYILASFRFLKNKSKCIIIKKYKKDNKNYKIKIIKDDIEIENRPIEEIANEIKEVLEKEEKEEK